MPLLLTFLSLSNVYPGGNNLNMNTPFYSRLIILKNFSWHKEVWNKDREKELN